MNDNISYIYIYIYIIYIIYTFFFNGKEHLCLPFRIPIFPRKSTKSTEASKVNSSNGAADASVVRPEKWWKILGLFCSLRWIWGEKKDGKREENKILKKKQREIISNFGSCFVFCFVRRLEKWWALGTSDFPFFLKYGCLSLKTCGCISFALSC